MIYRSKGVNGRSMAKYGNRKVTALDGQTFDSRREFNRYAELSLLEEAGIISDLRRQVRFELLPAQRVGKVTERPVTYIADFVYTDHGQTVVEDAKGVRTKEYILKRKLMLYRFGIAIKEV